MPTHENLSVPYHQQDTDYYCGAACAQMVLAEAKVGAGLLDQSGLYADNHSHSTTESGWASGPDGLAWTLNNRAHAAGFTNSFVLFSLSTEDSISRKICWTVHHYQVAPVALVYGWAHWVTVRGYETSAAPAAYDDTTYSIDSFDINNPWPPTPSASNPTAAPPPPHSSGDNCGTGGDRGIDNENISYATWQTTYMTGVPSGHWSGQYLAVCDPEPPSSRVGVQRRPARRFDGNRLLSVRESAEVATRAIAEYRLIERERWKDALLRTETGEPILVQDLHLSDSYYYIVPMGRGGEIGVLVNVDARFGFYRQAAMLSNRKLPMFPRRDAKSLIELVMAARIELPERGGRLRIRPEALCLYPILVWRPCLESLSPYWPFYMLTVGLHRIYVRVDGAVFSALHDAGPGF